MKFRDKSRCVTKTGDAQTNEYTQYLTNQRSMIMEHTSGQRILILMYRCLTITTCQKYSSYFTLIMKDD